MNVNETWHRRGIRALTLLGKIVYIMFGGLRVWDAHKVPMEGPVLIVANHSSLADPVGVLVTCPRIVHYMAAAELFDIPVMGKVITFLQAFPVKRGQNDVKAIKRCLQLLKEGQGVVMFPEGKVSEDGYLGELYDGAAMMALRAKCPVVPLAMSGFDKMLPLGSKFPHFAYKQVRFGDPITFDFSDSNLSLKEQAALATAQIRQALLDLGCREKPAQD